MPTPDPPVAVPGPASARCSVCHLLGGDHAVWCSVSPGPASVSPAEPPQPAYRLVAKGEDTPEERDAARLNRGWRWTLHRMIDPRHWPWCNARYAVWPDFGTCKWRRGHPGPHVNHSGTVWFDAR